MRQEVQLNQKEFVQDISDILLATLMGAVIVNELTGPFITRYLLKKSGETPTDKDVIIRGSWSENK